MCFFTGVVKSIVVSGEVMESVCRDGVLFDRTARPCQHDEHAGSRKEVFYPGKQLTDDLRYKRKKQIFNIIISRNI